MKALTATKGNGRLHRLPTETPLLGSAYTVPPKGPLQKPVTLEPIEDRLLVQPCELEKTTAGGILIPDTAQGAPRRGTVLAVGPGVRLETGAFVAPVIQTGDTVWFERFAGGELEINGQALRLIREADVVARERSA